MKLRKICFIKKGYNGEELDDDRCSLSLQQFHKIIWDSKYYEQYFKNMRWGSDTLFTGFKGYKICKNPIIEIRPNEFHKLAHTFGGKIIFPKHKNSINVRRGRRSEKIYDRIDFTLKYIQDFFYDPKNLSKWNWNDENLLFKQNNKILELDDENFFKLFDTFENFIEFFYLQDFVREKQKEKDDKENKKKEKEYEIIDLMKSENLRTPIFIQVNDKPCLPSSFSDYGRWCDNSMDLLEKRNGRIDDFINNSKNQSLKNNLQQIINHNKVSNYQYLK